jgi:hypothetical protein
MSSGISSRKRATTDDTAPSGSELWAAPVVVTPTKRVATTAAREPAL